MRKIKIENAVFCEGVRYEVGGKHTLLGVSAPELDIQQYPGVVSVAIWMGLAPAEAGDYEADFRVRDSDRTDLIKARMNFSLPKTAHGSLVVGPMPLQVNKPGSFSFEWNLGGGKWEKIIVLHINAEGGKK